MKCSFIGAVALCIVVWWTNSFLITLFMKLNLGSTSSEDEGFFSYPAAFTGLVNLGAAPGDLRALVLGCVPAHVHVDGPLFSIGNFNSLLLPASRAPHAPIFLRLAWDRLHGAGH